MRTLLKACAPIFRIGLIETKPPMAQHSAAPKAASSAINIVLIHSELTAAPYVLKGPTGGNRDERRRHVN